MAIQDKFNKTNVIYKITKDISLEGGTLTIPEECTLDFQGGSIINGTIVGNNTKIKAGLQRIFNIDITLNGTWIVNEAYPEWFRVFKNGVDDDAFAIRKALKLLENSGGGILQLNQGTYYCNSGDPSFADGSYNPALQWENTSEYYSCFRIVNNVIVQGVGNSTIIVINQDRLGNRTLGGNFRVAPPLFSNYLQRSGYLLSGKFILQNLKVLGKNNGTSPYPYSNGNLIEVYNSLGVDPTDNNCPGEVVMTNVTTENIVGFAHINVTNILNAELTNCVCTKFGKDADPKASDYSVIFANSINVIVNNCLFKLNNLATDYVSTAVELHANNGIITNNTCLNLNKFCNLCGSPNTRTPSNYIVSNNIATVNIFTNPYVFSFKSINTIKLNNNNITLYYNKDILNGYYPTVSRTLMINETEDIIVPIKKYIIENNTISLADLGGTGLTTYAYGIINDIGIEELSIKNNSLYDILGSLGQFNSIVAKVREFINNTVSGFLTKTNPETPEKYMLYITKTATNPLKVNISNNIITNTKSDTNIGVLYFNFLGSKNNYNNDLYIITDNKVNNVLTPFVSSASSSTIEATPLIVLKHDETINNPRGYTTVYSNLNSLSKYLKEGSSYKIFKDGVYYKKEWLSNNRVVVSGIAIQVPTIYDPIIAGAIIKDGLASNRYFYSIENSFKIVYNFLYGTISERPNGVIIGQLMYDTTLNKLICYNGTAWVNVDGTPLT